MEELNGLFYFRNLYFANAGDRFGRWPGRVGRRKPAGRIW